MTYEAAAVLVSATYMYMFIYLLCNNLWILLAGILASKKGRSVGGWITGAIFLGLLAVLILAFLSDQTVRARPRITHVSAKNSSSNGNSVTNQSNTPSCWNYFK